MKRLRFYTYLLSFFNFSCSAIASDFSITKAEEITYDFLKKYGEETGCGEHISHVKQIFDRVKISKVLEFGLGYSTKYFLDSSTKVMSVEFITSGSGPLWIKKCLELYKDYSNWVPVAYFSHYAGDISWAPYKFVSQNDLLQANDYQAHYHHSYAAIDTGYYQELSTFISNITKYNHFDFALVDPGSYLRGELVQILFGKIPILVAHDANAGMKDKDLDCYGYAKVATPEDYEQIFIPQGKGTVIWIQKNRGLDKLITELKIYAAQL